MSNSSLQVAIIMGSDSDLPVVEASFSILESFGVKYTKNVMSAHRTPHDVMDLIKRSIRFDFKAVCTVAHIQVAKGMCLILMS